MQQPDQYLELQDLSTSHHSSRTFTGCLSIEKPYTRLLHYVILHYLALALNTCLTLLMFILLLDPLRSSSDTRILSTPNVILKCPMVSVLLPTTVPLHGILCHSRSDINRNLIASSGLWKLICFLWINVTIMFSMLLCYYVLLFMFFGLCFVRFMGHVGACSTKCSWDVLPDALYLLLLWLSSMCLYSECHLFGIISMNIVKRLELFLG